MIYYFQNVISEGAGGEMISHYKSVIYYHEDKPKWCETVKVCMFQIDAVYWRAIHCVGFCKQFHKDNRL